jgi:hypothetical protein
MSKKTKPDQSKFVRGKDLNDVKYVYGGIGSTGGYGLYIDGYWVMKRTFEAAWLQAKIVVPALDPGDGFFTKDIWEPEAWEPLANGEKHNLGRALVFFSEHGMLPLRVLNPQATGSKKFERI